MLTVNVLSVVEKTVPVDVVVVRASQLVDVVVSVSVTIGDVAVVVVVVVEVEVDVEVDVEVELLVLVVEVVEVLLLVLVAGAGTIPNAVPRYTSEVDNEAETVRPLDGLASCSHSAYTVGVLE